MEQATRFMRKPFICKGFMVREDNMNTIAEWCGGKVNRDDPSKPFIQVPVFRATNPKQCQAFLGTWVIVSIFNDMKSYKVYKPEWLDESFFNLSTWDGDPADDTLPDNGACLHCATHTHSGANPAPLRPPVPGPRPGPRPIVDPIFQPARVR